MLLSNTKENVPWLQFESAKLFLVVQFQPAAILHELLSKLAYLRGSNVTCINISQHLSSCYSGSFPEFFFSEIK